MCRSIKTLFNFEPAATDTEIEAAALQYVRKVSGFAKPSTINQTAFDQAVGDITTITQALLDSLTTTATPKDRQTEISKAKARSLQRFGTLGKEYSPG